VSSGDRVAVPTNGHRPALKDDALDSPHHDASTSRNRRGAGATDRPDVDVDADAAAATPASPTVTSGQIIAGVGVLTALALVLLGRRRRG